ncbi:MAG: hypothetical protein KME45_00100 [Stenomitos rutilans HA7619-LM2]|jgi:outer membrane biosynthesis protein TonB|nr:hypothetical protein [Stenomitos rutilans HA7619-LM2]
MSNSFLPKKAPNVLNQETLERALVVLRQPFAIAVLASLGLHGLLWAALPNILAETAKEADTKQRVRTIELSPAEQGQLPSLGLTAIPPTLLPTTPTKPAQSNTKLPDPKRYNDPSLYNFPLIQPPPPDVFPSFGLPPTTFDFNPPTVKKTPKSSPKPTTKPTTPSAPPNESRAATTPDKNSPGETNTPVDPNAPVRPETLSSQQVAALQKDAERSRQLRSLYAFNGPTSLTERSEIGNQNATKLFESADKLSGGNYKKTHFGVPLGNVISDLFPKEACPYVKTGAIASVAAIVKPDAQLAEPPSILVPSGFKGLDDLAIDYVAKKDYTKAEGFSTDGNYQVLRFNFFFDPKSACPTSDNPA